MTENPIPAAELAGMIRRLRIEAGLTSQEALADRVGFSQSKVSRLEKGVERKGGLAPSPLDAGRLAWALRDVADRHTRRRMIDLARTVAQQRAGVHPLRVALVSGDPRAQDAIGELEEAAGTVVTFHPAMVPGLLQTEEYMRSIAASSPTPSPPARVEAWVAARLRRQLNRAGKPAVQLVTEGALCWGVAGQDAMARQCEHIARLILERPSWEIGVIPRYLPPGMPLDYPPNGFDLYDRDAVLVGTTAGNAEVRNREIIDSHFARLGRLRALALFGEPARKLLARLAREYRGARPLVSHH